MENVTLEQAIELITDSVTAVTATETVTLIESLGRILAEDVIADFNNPPYDRSPIDGYACKAEDIADVEEGNIVKLKVIDEVFAGQYTDAVVNNGEAVRIMTGAAIPSGCDCCVWQENTDYGEDEVSIFKPVSKFENYCFAGEDFKIDTELLKKGEKLNYVDIGVLASAGRGQVNVYKKPSIALITTGDEVMTPGEKLNKGCIYNSNQSLIATRLIELGYGACIVTEAADNAGAVAKKITDAFDTADIVITTGGVSVGKKDIMHDAIKLIGAERVFWKVNIKPGSPTIYSLYNCKPIISLSGNPFGAAANFELLVRPLIAKMSLDNSVVPRKAAGVINREFIKGGNLRRFIRAVYNEGKVYIPEGLHSAGVLASMRGCNCLVDIGAGNLGVHIGDRVNVLLIN
ncbi:MAG: gephyrin-like molybdotransferase Glp [Candidatus Metalachnospira sp.]|nr:gephyrin-like molybdotransferase Glp [Candidatus Metalachnospira sp.]